ncbi:hypothetical protein Phum_PHUM454540 [Pediculus humanus corporis]|uniref:Uncharacterized protein n=1 Tax=Pediculus humanus subsp. corporis TaxID=121224 RepID=E0VUT0_PEDHC|nr:uncharacterized protein Phum_PHUM454540 [Pediculus humanus corporis]EEB17136.1 hypothetical protein Phum_PHUM454540 [Pediculus humanus corporis]
MSVLRNEMNFFIKKEKNKITGKGLKNFLSSIGRKIFGKVNKNEIEYGEATLTKKKRKNCILKSVSSLSSYPIYDDDGFFIHSSSPYHINFNFSKENNNNNNNIRGGFLTRKKNLRGKNKRNEFCCRECHWGKLLNNNNNSYSKFSIVSSDSACDLSLSESSCDDLKCIYRKPEIKLKRKRSKSAGDLPGGCKRTVENFIKIHNDNIKNEFFESLTRGGRGGEGEEYNNDDDDTVHSYESLMYDFQKYKNFDDSDYDFLLTKSNYKVIEPSYENLKVIENCYANLLAFYSKHERGTGRSADQQVFLLMNE